MSRTAKFRAKYAELIKSGNEVTCAICKEPITSVSVRHTEPDSIRNGGKGYLSIDHIIEKRQGGTSRQTNLQPTHALCNHMKSNIFKKVVEDE